ncbi:hypothetical protein ACFQH3_18995 [Haladaptatus sp. GCM10025707]|uniref:HEAT repeat domain-containing protein n=1 Tax=Haladaptatus sp. GCM10025707 TaxID=3252658 RepID=UPI0036178DF8
MSGNPSLAELMATAEREPEAVDIPALCRYLSSDEYEVTSQAHDIRTLVTNTVPNPIPVAESLIEIIESSEHNIALTAAEMLSRLVRIWPQELAPRITDLLTSTDVRIRAVGVNTFGNGAAGAFVPYIDMLAKRLTDDDLRVAAYALGSLTSLARHYPERVAPHLDAVVPFLDERWFPSEAERFNGVYAALPDEPDGTPPKRLVRGIPHPHRDALSLLRLVGSTRPNTLTPVVSRLHELVVSMPAAELDYESFIRILGDALRADVEVADTRSSELIPALRTHAESDERGRRISARRLLSELGYEVDHPPAFEVPPMATRNRPVQPDDEEFLRNIDIEIDMGTIELDDIIERLHCVDSDVRDTTAWGLECGYIGYLDELNDRGPTLLSLFDEPDECTRGHLFTTIGAVVQAYPEEWTPPLLELTTHADVKIRAAATGQLANVASTYPTLLFEHIETITTRLDDEPEVMAAAFRVLGSYAQFAPTVVSKYVADASAVLSTVTLTDELEGEETVQSVLRFLLSLAKVQPAAIVPAIDAVSAIVTELAGPETIANRALGYRRSPEEHLTMTPADFVLEAALEVCTWVGKHDPDAISPFDQLQPGLSRAVTMDRHSRFRC